MHIETYKCECLWLFCAWFHPCIGLEDTIVCVIWLNFDSVLLCHYFKCLISFDSFLAAVSCLEMSITESGCLINKFCWNVVAFGGKSPCKLWNDPWCWWFELIYRSILSWLCRFGCIAVPYSLCIHRTWIFYLLLTIFAIYIILESNDWYYSSMLTLASAQNELNFVYNGAE